jgi:hypothetical protein
MPTEADRATMLIKQLGQRVLSEIRSATNEYFSETINYNRALGNKYSGAESKNCADAE